MNIFEAIIVVERLRRRKVELASAERTGAYSKRIGAEHHDEAAALGLVLAAARKEAKR